MPPPPLPRQAKPILCYVTSRRELAAGSEEDLLRALLLRQISLAASAGVDWIQIREKDLETSSLISLVGAAVNSAHPARVLVNDRLDVAIAARAAGVHLGRESLPVMEVFRWRERKRAPANFMIGASCHSLEEALAAELDGADYLFFGPVFPTPSKLSFGPPQGLHRLATVCRAVHIPVLAIGGISVENSNSCLESGAAGIAAIRMFQEVSDEAKLAALISRSQA